MRRSSSMPGRIDANIWWALVKRRVSDRLDLKLLAQPAYEVRVEARIRVSHAPRRVNLHVNTQRTTDFHSHLMEFDIPDSDQWHTIGFTTRQFDAGVGDTVFAQLALIDWGLDTSGSMSTTSRSMSSTPRVRGGTWGRRCRTIRPFRP